MPIGTTWIASAPEARAVAATQAAVSAYGWESKSNTPIQDCSSPPNFWSMYSTAQFSWDALFLRPRVLHHRHPPGVHPQQPPLERGAGGLPPAEGACSRAVVTNQMCACG